jgi:hypothetical protein
MIPTYQPKIEVTLKKVQRRSGASRIAYLSESRIPDIDLTPHLGEMGSVTTTRSINQPAGTFSITLADKMDVRSLDTLYASIEPMDMVVIRFARLQKGELPIIMRGLVSHVERSESMGQDGKPHRTVTVTGHDFGKFLQIMQISYLREYIYENFLLTHVPMYEAYGLWFGNQTPSQFVTAMMDSLVSGDWGGGTGNSKLKPFLVALFEKSGLDAWIQFQVDATVVGARVGPFGMVSDEGDVWNMMSRWCDLGWNELFIEDRPDASYLVFRPVPYYSLAKSNKPSELIMASDGAVVPEYVYVDIDEVESLHLSRTDGNVTNFFQVDAPMAEIINPEWIKVQATQNGLALEEGNRNCSPDIYGLKKMNARTMQSMDTTVDMRMQAATEAKPEQAAVLGDWYRKRLKQLREIHEDNVVFEEGHLSMRGNEAIKPGIYIRLKRGNQRSRFYVTSVTHTYTPFNPFKTSLQLTRGESYIDRLETEGSPYQAETLRG